MSRINVKIKSDIETKINGHSPEIYDINIMELFNKMAQIQNGDGDSMVAGFIADYIKNEDYESALKCAIVMGSATAFSEGVAGKNKVEELLGCIDYQK